MKENRLIRNIRKSIINNGIDSLSNSLISQLKGINLPVNPTTKLNYLLKEREFLIQLIDYYQEEYNVNFL